MTIDPDWWAYKELSKEENRIFFSNENSLIVSSDAPDILIKAVKEWIKVYLDVNLDSNGKKIRTKEKLDFLFNNQKYEGQYISKDLYDAILHYGVIN